MDLEQLQRKVGSWHHQKYGQAAPTNLDKTFRKLAEEVGELARAIGKGDEANAREEIVDCFLILVNLMRGFNGDLAAEVTRKLAILMERLHDPNAGRQTRTDPGGGPQGPHPRRA